MDKYIKDKVDNSYAGWIEDQVADEFKLITALSEFIDNSIADAKENDLEEVKVKIFQVNFQESPSLIIMDNSAGISSDNFKKFWTLHNRSSKKDKQGLNHAGIGAKRAGFGLASKLIIAGLRDGALASSYIDYNNQRNIELRAKSEGKYITDLTEHQSCTEEENQIIRKWFQSQEFEHGTIIILNNLWDEKKSLIQEFSNVPFKTSNLKLGLKKMSDDTKSGTNLYWNLYLKYNKYIDGLTEGPKLKLSILTEHGQEKIEEINAKSIQFPKSVVWTKGNTLAHAFQEIFINSKDAEIKSFSKEFSNNNKIDENLIGPTVSQMFADLSNGINGWDFQIKIYSRNNPKVAEFVKFNFYFILNLVKYNAPDRMLNGFVLYQDGRAINYGAVYEKKDQQLSRWQNLLKHSGDHNTENRYWTGDIFLDFKSDQFKEDYVINSRKTAFAQTKNINHIYEEISKVFKTLDYMEFIKVIQSELISKMANNLIKTSNEEDELKQAYKTTNKNKKLKVQLQTKGDVLKSVSDSFHLNYDIIRNNDAEVSDISDIVFLLNKKNGIKSFKFKYYYEKFIDDEERLLKIKKERNIHVFIINLNNTIVREYGDKTEFLNNYFIQIIHMFKNFTELVHEENSIELFEKMVN